MHAPYTDTHTHSPPPMQPWGGVSGEAGDSAARHAGEGYVSDRDTVMGQRLVAEETFKWNAATPTLPVVSQLQLIAGLCCQKSYTFPTINSPCGKTIISWERRNTFNPLVLCPEQQAVLFSFFAFGQTLPIQASRCFGVPPFRHLAIEHACDKIFSHFPPFLHTISSVHFAKLGKKFVILWLFVIYKFGSARSFQCSVML